MNRKKEIVVKLSDGETWEVLGHFLEIGFIEYDKLDDDYFPFDDVCLAVKYGESDGVTFTAIADGYDIERWLETLKGV